MKSLVFVGLSALMLTGFGPLSIGANAQVFSSQRSPQNQQSQNQQSQNRQVAQSSVLQAAFDRDETLYLDRDGTYEYDLVLRRESNFAGRRLPVGTIIRGQFQPAEGGLVYVANSVELSDRIVQINAVSELMRDNKDPRQTSAGAIATDAAIGAAGGYVLGEVFGDAGFWEIAGGAAAGVLVGNTTAPLVVVVRPDQEIALYSN
ncbi:MAG: hypothetical protein AAFR25_06180 [Cyanobacteria bacterium J06629_19]